MTSFDSALVLRAVLPGYRLSVHGCHGPAHWARVLENGERLAERTGANLRVVQYFALLHDARRVNEHHDPGHGRRGGDLARELRGSVVHLSDHEFELLYEACRLHTKGLTEGDVTLRACWDADRLDLGRVGITPRPDRLCTDAGRELLEWAHARAVAGVEPEVLTKWALDPSAAHSHAHAPAR